MVHLLFGRSDFSGGFPVALVIAGVEGYSFIPELGYARFPQTPSEGSICGCWRSFLLDLPQNSDFLEKSEFLTSLGSIN